MKVKIAKEAGFCFGVKRAMKMAWDELELNSDIYALGPLIHNRQAVQKYEDKGLITVNTIDDIPNNESVIIRSHGVSKDIYDKANFSNLNIIDTTCPFVKKIHNIVKEFYEKGYNTFVLTYTTNLLMSDPLKLQPLKDLSRAVKFIRKNSNKFFINENKIILCGFSAGGHLVGSLAVHYKDKELNVNEKYKEISNRPDAIILSYPVITTGEYAHKESFIALLGFEATDEEVEYMSLEKHVTKDTPPTFLWQTATDEVVSVENSYLFAKACKEKEVIFEHHVFANGKHGMSLANNEWANGINSGDYTMEQVYENIKFLIENNVLLPEPFDILNGIKASDELIIAEIKERMKRQIIKETPDKAIAIWPQISHNWVSKVLEENNI